MERVVAAALAVLALVACSGDDGAGPDPPPADRSSTSSTSLIDYSAVPLQPVGGETTTTLDQGGSSDVQGFVTSAAGPVGGATVRIERLVFDAVVTTDVFTRPGDGGFDLPQIPGGRYRVRAFLAPTLAQVEPAVFFLKDGDQKQLDLVVDERSGLEVRAAVAPGMPLEGGSVNLVVQVTTATVDTQGVVRSQPVLNELVQLGGGGRWRLESSNQVLTDGEGKAGFELTCETAGPPQLVAQLGSGEVVALDLPDCVDPATLTTTTAAAPPGQTTTTAKR
jgi:hypothetical protein